MRFIKSRTTLEWTIFLFILCALTVLYMAPAARSCGGVVLGKPGDGTAGGVWRTWVWQHDHAGLFAGHSNVTAFPIGEQSWQATSMTALVWMAPLWLFSTLFSAPCAWNLTMAFGMIATGIAMFALVKWLFKNWYVAVFASLAYTFSPYRQFKLDGHVGYVHAEGVLLITLATFKLWDNPTKSRITLLAFALALTAYSDGYYVLLGGALVITLNLALFLYKHCAMRYHWADLRKTFAALGIGLLGGAMLCSPIILTLLLNRSSINSSLPRNASELDVYGARLWEYLLPSRNQPLYGKHLFAHIRQSHIHSSNPSETNLYLGTIVVVLGIYALYRLFIRGRKTPTDSDVKVRQIGFVATVVGLVCILASLPAHNHILGLTIPGFSEFEFSILPLWRVFSRFFIIVDIAAVLLAATGLFLLTRSMSPKRQALACGFITVACLFDLLNSPPLEIFTYRSSPSVYKWIATQPGNAIAEYPMQSIVQSPDGPYFTFQPVHGKEMVNARSAGLGDGIQQDLAGLNDPDTAGILNTIGVRYVIVHPEFANYASVGMPAGYTLIKRFRYADELMSRPKGDDLRHFGYLKDFYDADVYQVPSTPHANAIFSLSQGFYGPEVSNWKASDWMGQTATTRILPLDHSTSSRHVSLNVLAFANPKNLVISQGKSILWSGTVSYDSHIDFVAAPGQDIEWKINSKLVPVNKVIPGSKDTRVLGLYLSNIDVR